jgi:hypothetical protein
MLDLLPKAPVVQMRVVEQLFRGAHRAPGKAAFLGVRW